MEKKPPEKTSLLRQPAAFRVLAGLLGITFLLTGVSSEYPDGFEASAHRVGLEEGPPSGRPTLDDLVPGGWGSRAIGILFMGLIAWAGCAWLGTCREKRPSHRGS